MRNAILLLSSIVLCVETARAQVIQLPSFHQFSVDTTVVVPDSGAASVAGNRTGRAARSNFNGLPPARGAGIEVGPSGASVHAQIHDPAAREQELSLRAKQNGAVGQQKSSLQPGARVSGRTPAVDAPLPGVAEIRRMQAARSPRTATKTKK